MPEVQTVSQVARQIGVPPQTISMLFYTRVLPDSAAPVSSGRRLIPKSLIPEIEKALRSRGVLPEVTEPACA